MSIAALIRKMTEAGATPEAIALAVEAIEAVNAKDAERKAKQRERTAKSRAKTRDSNVTVTAPSRQGNDEPSSPLDGPLSFPQTPNLSPLNPPTSSETGGAGDEILDAEIIETVEAEPVEAEPVVIPFPAIEPEQTARGTRLSTDWQPTENLIAFARKEGLTDAQIERELARFRDYWLGATGRNATKRDWGATFRNWMREAADRQRRTGRVASAGRGSSGGDLLGAYQRAAARFANPNGASE